MELKAKKAKFGKLFKDKQKSLALHNRFKNYGGKDGDNTGYSTILSKIEDLELDDDIRQYTLVTSKQDKRALYTQENEIGYQDR